MIFSRTFLAAALAALAVPALAHDGMAVRDPYLLVATGAAKTAGAFMVVENHRAIDDRLVGASSDAAARVEMHSHVEDDQGVMRMREIEDGILIAAGGEHALTRGGDHLMFLGLTRPLAEGDVVQVTLTFETTGDLEIEVPVRSGTDANAHDHGHSGHHQH